MSYGYIDVIRYINISILREKIVNFVINFRVDDGGGYVCKRVYKAVEKTVKIILKKILQFLVLKKRYNHCPNSEKNVSSSSFLLYIYLFIYLFSVNNNNNNNNGYSHEIWRQIWRQLCTKKSTGDLHEL